MSEVTEILTAMEKGASRAEDLLPVVYEELRHLAASKLAREAPGQGPRTGIRRGCRQLRS